jgi:NAD(P)-dependent dehydrogenase (short-subunit alcohol dehydrogenase family)
MLDLTNRVALITGATGNLGTATAHAFKDSQAKLALVSRSMDRLKAEFPDLTQDESVYLSDPTDLTKPADVEKTVSKVLSHYGQIDILLNLAGGYRGGKPVHRTPLDTYQFLQDINVRTLLIMCQNVIPHMLERGAGTIINIGASVALRSAGQMGAYAASKSAVVRLTESMAAELKSRGVRVNCVLPGTIDTPENRKMMPDADYSRWVSPVAIADVLLFLASDASRAINGSTIPVYGSA